MHADWNQTWPNLQYTLTKSLAFQKSRQKLFYSLRGTYIITKNIGGTLTHM